MIQSAETSNRSEPSCPPVAGQRRLLDIDPGLFAEKFGREPFLIEHQLCDHPLFNVDRLLQLAQTLPEKHIEYNAGNLPVVVEPGKTPANGLSAAETIRRIRECKSWLVLKYVEQDPEYADLLERCLAEVAVHSEPIYPGMCSPQSFIFLTSPGSVTPYHIDPEHNFLLQIRGAKKIRMFDGRDRSILSEQDLEQLYSDSDDQERNLQLEDANREKGWTFDLQSGYGLHFPVTYPHWVENGDEVSISYSITFRTPDLYRRQVLYALNDRRRRNGESPRPVGEAPLREFYDFQSYRIRNRLSSMFKRS
ncbi:MAG: cupin-like domain-containing protein [Planctomycetaceae bacterium]|nr:cupin-like domain-containing protein [Planctomycetaceae bacterium]